MLKYLTALAVLLIAVPALAQKPPTGQRVLNQGRSFVAVTPHNDNDIVPTRGLHIGDAAACHVAVIGVGDSSPVVLPNLQPGQWYPAEVKRIRVTGTTCTSIIAIR
jgi:hypothetical protein